jgi:hypothetical protein
LTYRFKFASRHLSPLKKSITPAQRQSLYETSQRPLQLIENAIKLIQVNHSEYLHPACGFSSIEVSNNPTGLRAHEIDTGLWDRVFPRLLTYRFKFASRHLSPFDQTLRDLFATSKFRQYFRPSRRATGLDNPAGQGDDGGGDENNNNDISSLGAAGDNTATTLTKSALVNYIKLIKARQSKLSMGKNSVASKQNKQRQLKNHPPSTTTSSSQNRKTTYTINPTNFPIAAIQRYFYSYFLGDFITSRAPIVDQIALQNITDEWTKPEPNWIHQARCELGNPSNALRSGSFLRFITKANAGLEENGFGKSEFDPHQEGGDDSNNDDSISSILDYDASFIIPERTLPNAVTTPSKYPGLDVLNPSHLSDRLNHQSLQEAHLLADSIYSAIERRRRTTSWMEVFRMVNLNEFDCIFN